MGHQDREGLAELCEQLTRGEGVASLMKAEIERDAVYQAAAVNGAAGGPSASCYAAVEQGVGTATVGYLQLHFQFPSQSSSDEAELAAFAREVVCEMIVDWKLEVFRDVVAELVDQINATRKELSDIDEEEIRNARDGGIQLFELPGDFTTKIDREKLLVTFPMDNPPPKEAPRQTKWIITKPGSSTG